MKLLVTILLLFLSPPYAQQRLNDRLCKANEEIIISFLTPNKKVVTICKDKTDKYLVYRFGTKQHVELQFPSLLDSKSWHEFTYSGEWRFGGIQNAGFGDLSLSFINLDTKYIVFQNWNDEDSSSDFGLLVSKNHLKDRSLVIDKQSKIGSLLKLNETKQIKNIALDQ
jgi:hypothetical protein